MSNDLRKHDSLKQFALCAIMSHIQSQNSENEVSHIYPNRAYSASASQGNEGRHIPKTAPLKRQIPVAFVYLTGYKSRSLSPSRVFTIVQR